MRALNPPKDNETQATVGVVFHGTTAITDLPQNDVVAQTLVEALNNSTNSPNLSINPASVKVLEFKEVAFSPALTDSNSDEYKALETAALNACNKKYRSMFPNTFSHCILKNFSALNPPKDKETQATVGVVFHGTTAIADLPQNDVVAQTLVEALNNSTNSPNLSINPASVKVLEFKEVAFSPALTDSNSDEYKALETAALNAQVQFQIRLQLLHLQPHHPQQQQHLQPLNPLIFSQQNLKNPVPDQITTAPPTTTPSTATTTPATPEPTYILSAEFKEVAFSPALTDSNSDEYKALETAALNAQVQFQIRLQLLHLQPHHPQQQQHLQPLNPLIFSQQNLKNPVPDQITTAPPTTTPSAATTTPAAPEPTYILSAEFKEVAFSPALTDSNSDEYKALETAALNACNKKYRSMFPNTFSHCILKNFSALNPPKDNETQATVGVVFHGTTAITDLPQNDVVAQTLVAALNNSTNSPILSINPASVKVLEFKEVAFSPALTDSNSDEYKALETAALNACNKKYRSMFPNTFSHCILKNFSALNPPKDNETQATVGVVFHGTTAIADLPQNDVVAQTLVEALNNSTNSLDVSINPASVKVLEFKEVAFSPALTDSNSDEYKALETAALNACNKKYRSMFPNTFSHCILKNFSALNPPKDNETQATVGVVFHGTTAIADLPQNDVVAQTLVEALNNSTNSLDVSINPASVKVLASPVPDQITTAPPTTTPSAATTTPAAPEPTYILSAEFKEVTFSPALTDSNSDEYKALETAALNACNKKYRSMFPNTFSHCILKNFSKSSSRSDYNCSTYNHTIRSNNNTCSP
ncbi:hypothetical protein NQZ68_036818 [Dissostichus eleginoides]|nr:hypothetical protein NQZ68_036818 [Dissostichus eleginoides]